MTSTQFDRAESWWRLVWRTAVALVLTVGLATCGGGGGTSTSATLSLSVRQISVSALTNEPAPAPSFEVSLGSPPDEGVYVDYSTSGSIVASVDTRASSATQGTVSMVLLPPALLGAGVYTGSVQVSICYDSACERHVGGSPQTVSLRYTVTAAGGQSGSALSPTSLSPASVAEGSGGFTLVITGSGFVPESVLQWNGQARTTTYDSPTQLTARIPATDVAAAGKATVRVGNGAAGSSLSAPFDFDVTARSPFTLGRLSPSRVDAGGAAFELTVVGTGFTSASEVRWNGSPRRTRMLSTTALSAEIEASDFTQAGTASVTVFNPKAPGVLSNARPMRITAPSADAVAFQINPGHTGATRFADANLPAASLWSVDLGGTPSYALLADGKVFVTVSMQGDNSQVVALDQATGAVVWGPQPIAGQAGAAYQGGSVFVVGSIFGQPALLQAFDATTGLTQWRTLLAGQWVFTAPPTAANGKVYVAGAGGGGTLYAVSQGTGQLAWTQRVSGGEGTAPAVSADGVFVTPACNAFALQAATGAPLWSDIGCSGAGGAIPVLANGVLYAPYGRANYDGSTFNAVTGSRLGAYAADNPPAIGSDAGYFLQGGTLRGVGLAGNTALWSFAGDGTLVTSPIIVNDWVFVGGSSGNLYALDAQTGRLLWEQDLGAPLPAGAGWNARLPISGMMAGNGLLVVPVGNRLTAYRLSSSP